MMALRTFVQDPSTTPFVFHLALIVQPHCSIFSHLPHHPPMYCRLSLLDAIAMDNHKTAKRKDNITTLLS
jgi:hypothetical protein